MNAKALKTPSQATMLRAALHNFTGILALHFLLSSGAVAFAQCQAPDYQVGEIAVDDASFFVGSVSIALRDFTPNKLVCLSSSLKEHYRDRSHILVYIFDSYEAAQESVSVVEITKSAFDTFAHIHALYSLDSDKQEQYVKILPAGVLPPRTASTEGRYSTRIDLPIANTPRCQLEIAERCLIVLKLIDYPKQALERRASGKVILTANINRDGLVNRVRVIKADSIRRGMETLLANAAVQNLSSWRLEAGGADATAVRITYSYAIDRSLRYEQGSQVHWALPNEIAIRQGPPK